MTVQLTKADEKQLLKTIIHTCPDGYVRDILTGVQCEIENAIDNDFGFITLSDRFCEIEEHRAAMLAAKTELSLLKTQIREISDDKRRLEYGLNELRSTVRQFARI